MQTTNPYGAPWYRLEPETDEDWLWWNAQRAQDRAKDEARARTISFFRKSGLCRPPCACGVAKTQMHHVDYAFWYLIAFLCVSCHIRGHRLGFGDLTVHDLRELAVADRVAFA